LNTKPPSFLSSNNLKTIIEDAGFDLKGVLKVTCHLSNIDDYESFNKVYSEYFPRERPARTTVQAGRLPMDIKVEIDAIIGRHNTDIKHLMTVTVGYE
jgi:enamine deaminase RidA (YjgF/YER057c/UK114 family)